MLNNSVRVYNGPGTCSECVDWTIEAFSSLYNSVTTISALEIKDMEWMATTKILIIPGGAANPYHNELGELGMDNIIKFVHSGRTLIGICAGAYFTAAQSNFALGTKLEVKNEHLGLFPGEAKGPFFKDFNYLDNTIHYSLIPCLDSISRNSHIHGGGWFIDPEKYQSISVLARYEYESCGRAAIIKITDCGKGKGMVLASHIHFEHPKVWSVWRDFIFNALEHEQSLVYSSEQTTTNLYK